MAQVIKIKRSTGSSAPGTLAVGELAYSKGSDTFYIGDPATANTPIAIGPAIKNNAGTAVLATGITAAEIRTLAGVDAAGTDNSTVANLRTNLTAISDSTTIGDATDVTITMAGALTVTGDLTVNGTTTTVNSTNTTLDDNLLELNSGASTNANDSGIIIERGSTGDNAIIMWDESADKFQVGTTTATASSTGNLTVATGTLVANVEGNVTGNLTIGGHAVDDIDITSEASDADDHLMTALAIKNRIEDYGYSTTVGDITQVIVSSTDSSITGGGTGATGNISFDLQVGTIDGGTYS
jgi:hypothetical protein